MLRSPTGNPIVIYSTAPSSLHLDTAVARRAGRRPALRSARRRAPPAAPLVVRARNADCPRAREAWALPCQPVEPVRGPGPAADEVALAQAARMEATELALAQAVRGIFSLHTLWRDRGDDAVADALGEFANMMWVCVDHYGVDAAMALLRAAVHDFGANPSRAG